MTVPVFQRIFRRSPNPPPTLRIVTWNCNMAFRRKIEHLLALQPDIAVIPEAERPETWGDIGATSILWHGDNRHKGLAVLSFGAWQLEAEAQRDSTIQYVLPARVNGPWQFNLMGVWTKTSPIRGQSYRGQVAAALRAYQDWLGGGPSMLVGDWNSNAVAGEALDGYSHSSVMAELSDLGLVSAYHVHRKERPGYEWHSTWYNHKWEHRGFHIDYCFIPKAWSRRLRKVSVGKLSDWRDHSDHVPLTVDLT